MMRHEKLEELRCKIAEAEADISCAEMDLCAKRRELIDLKIELAEV